MAGGGLPDIFGALGGGLSALAGQQPSSGGGGGGSGGGGTGITPANAPNSVFTDPLVSAPAALTAGDPTGLGQQQPQQAPIQAPTFTPAQPQQPQPVPYLSPEARNAAIGGAPTSGLAQVAQTADPNSAQPITAQVGAWPGASPLTPGVSPETQTGLTPQAEIAAGYRPPEATDADLQQAAEEQARKQGPATPDTSAIGASSIRTDQQPEQQKQQNPLQTVGRFLQGMADRTPGPNPPGSQGGGHPGGGINLIKALGDLITQGPGAFMQDLQGVAGQVGSNYEPQEYTSQGGARGYGYGADQPPAETAASPPPQQPSAPQPPEAPVDPNSTVPTDQLNPTDRAAVDRMYPPSGAAQTERAVTQQAAQGPAAAGARVAPLAQQASLTTGSSAAAQPIAQGEIQISPYSRHGAPPMRPTQPHVDVSPLRGEIGNPQTVQRMAQMVSQEVSLKPGNTRAQIVQLETLRNRALYGIVGNGRYPDGTRAPTSLAQAGQTIHGPYSRAGYAGYYPDYSRQRVSPQQLEKFKREVYDVVFPPDGSPGSNLSDVGYGPMTGNASNDPRMGERGMVAKHQYMRGTQGYSMRKSGGDDYFREHVRPGDALPQAGGQTATAQAIAPQRATADLSDLAGIVGATRSLAPGGIPWQDWRRSINVEPTGDYPAPPEGMLKSEHDKWLNAPHSSSLATLAGRNDIFPQMLSILARQYEQEHPGETVVTPTGR
jgi:hypothetical protein